MFFFVPVKIQQSTQTYHRFIDVSDPEMNRLFGSSKPKAPKPTISDAISAVTTFHQKRITPAKH